MRNRSVESRGPNVGWLFADLLLALAVVFLVANATGSIAVPPPPPPTPTPTLAPTPTPTPVPTTPPSSKYYFPFTVTFNDYDLEQGNSSAIADVQGQIRDRLSHYASCNAVLVLVFGGTPSLDSGPDATRARNAANAVTDQLRALGKQGFVFTHAQYHSPFLISSNFGTVVIQVYFYDTSHQCEPPPVKS